MTRAGAEASDGSDIGSVNEVRVTMLGAVRPRPLSQIKTLTNKIMIKRKEAAERLQVVYNTLEVRKLKYATIYKKIFKQGDCWRLIGYAHDYTV